MNKKVLKKELADLEPLDLKDQSALKGGYLSLNLDCNAEEDEQTKFVVNIYQCNSTRRS